MATRFPRPALDWLLEPCRRPIVDIGGGLTDHVSASHRVVATLHGDEVPTSAPSVRAKPSLLPFVQHAFDAALVTDGELLVSPVLAEIARVLAPGGELAAIEYSRDDSIPWVKRFAARLQEVDPTAMRATGSRLSEFINDSPHFDEPTEKRFRQWIPVSRDRLLGMVITRPAVTALDTDAYDALVADLLAIYDGAARPGEKLQLPFEVVAVRAGVDHSQLEPPPPRTDGLSIRLHF